MNTTLSTKPYEPAHRDRRLQSSVALVTGGGRGIGRFVARALGDAGASVAVVGRSGDNLDCTVDIIRESGGTATAAVADVADTAGLRAAVARVEREFGPISLLVNNAGIVGPIGPMWAVDGDDWWSAMEVNLRGTVMASRMVLPRMIARRRGRIINITSQAGAHRWPLLSAYSVSKAAVIKLTENLAHETARFGVSSFSVHPGLLPIGMSSTIIDNEPGTSYERHIRDWTMSELDHGRGADLGRAIELIMRIARGDADVLSGRHLSVHDDLDALLARRSEVTSRDLYVMRPQRLAEPAGRSRRAGHSWALSVLGARHGAMS